MIEVLFLKDHGAYPKGTRLWVDANSADSLVKSKAARRVNHTETPVVDTAETLTVPAPEE